MGCKMRVLLVIGMQQGNPCTPIVGAVNKAMQEWDKVYCCMDYKDTKERLGIEDFWEAERACMHEEEAVLAPGLVLPEPEKLCFVHFGLEDKVGFLAGWHVYDWDRADKKEAYQPLFEALKDESIETIGLCGMGRFFFSVQTLVCSEWPFPPTQVVEGAYVDDAPGGIHVVLKERE